MVGASQSLAGPNYVLNTIVAESLCEIADALESARDAADLEERVQGLLQRYAREHRRIVFNGDNYSAEWVAEAERRGLPNLRSTVESLATITDPEHAELFAKHRVLAPAELEARRDILLETYAKTIHIEALTMLQMIRRQVMPAAVRYAGDVAAAATAIATAGGENRTAAGLLAEVCSLTDRLRENTELLDKAVAACQDTHRPLHRAEAYRAKVVPAMGAVREAADRLETRVDATYWPMPTYAEMLDIR
jgi:glutamine synthetase